MRCKRCRRFLKNWFRVGNDYYGPVCILKLGLKPDEVSELEQPAAYDPFGINWSELTAALEGAYIGNGVGYFGYRGPNGARVAFIDVAKGIRQALDPRLDIAKHSPTGFEWGYGGSGPRQLAVAILAHALQAASIDSRMSFQFKADHTCGFNHAWFFLPLSEVQRWCGEWIAKTEGSSAAAQA